MGASYCIMAGMRVKSIQGRRVVIPHMRILQQEPTPLNNKKIEGSVSDSS